MSCSKVSCMLFTLSIILICHSPIASSDQDMIESVCSEAEDNGFGAGVSKEDCLNLLNMDPRFPSARDYHGLSKFIMQFAIRKGIKSQKNFIELAKNHTDSHAIHQCATIHYNSTISFFKGALHDLDVDPENAMHEASLARDGVETCKSAIDDEKIEIASIINMNKMMALLSDVAFCAISLFTEDHPPPQRTRA